MIVTVSRGKESTYMKTFTIDNDNNITVHPSRKAARDAGAGVFASEEQLAELIGADSKRLVDIWNSLAGVTPVTKFANRKVAGQRIWKAIQNLGEAAGTLAADAQVEAPVLDAIPAEFAAEPGDVAQPEAVVEAVQAEPEARPEEDATLQTDIEPIVLIKAVEGTEPGDNGRAEEPQSEPAEKTPKKKATRAKKTPKDTQESNGTAGTGPREGSKTAQVVAMLKTETGATLEEIMTKMGWQKHTVRGFMAGAMKKAGYTVESFKSEAGARSYRINP